MLVQIIALRSNTFVGNIVLAEDEPATVILTGHYGEAGAVNLLDPAYGLPRAIGGVNTYWLCGYGDPSRRRPAFSEWVQRRHGVSLRLARRPAR